MNNTYISMIVFLIITIVYYSFSSIGKIELTIETLKSVQTANSAVSTLNNSRVFLYLIIILITQIVINLVYVARTCGGDIAKNFMNAFVTTSVPWIFIFGAVISVLVMYPGFKSAFADIFGYFAVASNAHKLLSDILLDSNVGKALQSNGIDNIQPGSSEEKLKNAAESLMKYYSNRAVLINQITPDNFLSTWSTLEPLMKPNVFGDIVLQQRLLDVAVLRDNIGEASWYIYTAILVISVISYNLSSNVCNKSKLELDTESEKAKIKAAKDNSS